MADLGAHGQTGQYRSVYNGSTVAKNAGVGWGDWQYCNGGGFAIAVRSPSNGSNKKAGTGSGGHGNPGVAVDTTTLVPRVRIGARV